MHGINRDDRTNGIDGINRINGKFPSSEALPINPIKGY